MANSNTTGKKSGSSAKKDQLIQTIQNGIRSGIYRAGQPIPSERLLKKFLRLSRQTIHKGIVDLEDKGIIRRDGQRFFVADEALKLLGSKSAAPIHHVVVVSRNSNYRTPAYAEIFRTLTTHLPDSVHCEMRFYRGSEELAAKPPPEDAVVVVFGQWNPEDSPPMFGRNTIFINAQYENANYLIPDNYSGGRMLAEHLVALGHQRVAIMYLPQENLTREFSDRYQGIVDALSEHHKVFATMGALQQHVLEIAAKDVLERFLVHRDFTALIALKDVAAIELLSQARLKGVSIPDDFSLARFDDCCYSSFLNPPLTTVRFPVEEIALQAAQAVMEAFKRAPHECFCQKQVKTLLVKRCSTAVPRLALPVSEAN